jgi:hypothetical protein
MQDHTQTRNTVQSVAVRNLEQRQEELRLQRVDVLNLQEAIIANQMVPITHRNEPRTGIPFSALND